MARYKHNYLKELWLNRPWVYIPDVVRFMRNFPFKKGDKFFIWIRNCFYLNWQNCLVEVDDA